jgi:hypothetical protein
MAWAAALNLYVSFIAMFQSILHLLNSRNKVCAAQPESALSDLGF